MLVLTTNRNRNIIVCLKMWPLITYNVNLNKKRKPGTNAILIQQLNV